MRPPPAITSPRGSRFATCSALAWLALAACRPTSGLIELPPLPRERDAAAAEPEIPPGAKPCAVDADCDDAIDCTRDVCLPGHFCVNASDSSRCSDGVFCNGPELCDPATGCQPGTPETCGDDDLCTVDACDETLKACRHDPRDFDGDGEADWHCAGGTDCDDSDPTVGSNRSEICANSVDDDCDGRIDETDCARAQHDRCDDALDVSAGGSFQIALGGATPDYALGCSTASALDVAFSFRLTESHDVTLTASGLLSDGNNETAAVSLRTDCSDAATEQKCSHGFPAQVRVRALAPGLYFVIVSSDLAASVVLDVRFDPPSAEPTNKTCDSPIDVSAGGRFEGDFVDSGDDETLVCGFDMAGDLVYSFTTSELHDVEISAISLSGGRMSFELRTDCHDPKSALRCVSDSPARARFYKLPPGTYFVVLEGPASRDVDFGLDVAFVEPSDPPPGDGCGNPIELPLAMKVQGSLANRQDLVDVQCRCDPKQAKGECERYLPDVVYRVHVAMPTDLGVTLDGGSSPMDYAFRSTCDAGASQLACGVGTLVNGRVRNLVGGDYYLIIESSAPASDPAAFSIQLDQLPRTVPEPVSGNETCASAYAMPEDGGLFSGDTLDMLDDYQASCGGGAHSGDAVFKLTLSRRSRVTASLDASFDTVLYRYKDTGAGAASCQPKSDAACNDDGSQGNTGSLLSELLDAGTYYYVVDGFSDSNVGNYLFDVAVVPQ